jgi:hypothetical protein
MAVSKETKLFAEKAIFQSSVSGKRVCMHWSLDLEEHLYHIAQKGIVSLESIIFEGPEIRETSVPSLGKTAWIVELVKSTFQTPGELQEKLTKAEARTQAAENQAHKLRLRLQKAEDLLKLVNDPRSVTVSPDVFVAVHTYLKENQ